MVGIMPDNDVGGHFTKLLGIVESDTWGGLWKSLGVTVLRFEDLNLPRAATDLVVWQVCQSRQVILFTGNRNHESEESLEATIRTLNRPDSLPVFTLASPKRFKRSRAYAERVAVKFLECLMDLDNHRGSGRIYLP